LLSITTCREILCTIGPASLNQRVIGRLEDIGVSLFRINLSHTKTEDVEEVIREIQSYTRVPICLDSEGAQVRTGSLGSGSMEVHEGQLIEIAKASVSGDDKSFNLHPGDIVDQLELGDLLSIDFNSVLAQVIETRPSGVVVRVLIGGGLGQNKAVTVDKPMRLDALTEKDLYAFEVGKKYGIKRIALSFTNRASDIDQLRSIVGHEVFIISKIESVEGIRNLRPIAARANAILIDRGDLSREVPLEHIPRAQKAIIQTGKEMGAKVYVATNLLESMISSSNPTRAEVNDIFNTLLDGADGLVLAAETAIGQHPVQSASMVARVMCQYSEFVGGAKYLASDFASTSSSLLIAPHGGKLVQSVVSSTAEEVGGLLHVECNENILMDAENICVGTYSPIEGFMSKSELLCVVETGKLLDGTVWPMPITLHVSEERAREISKGQSIALRQSGNREVSAIVHVSEVFAVDLLQVCEKVFGVVDDRHPGVRQFRSQGNFCIAGKVELVKRLSLPGIGHHYVLTPRQTRKICEHKGWSRVGGFHTRNVCHRAHEFIQLKAHQDHYFDGLLIHPLVGSSRPGDYAGSVILDSYQRVIDQYYPKGQVLLAAYHNYPRFAGPKEALFTALCRKNFGCSHFIVGRDHSGVGDFYPKDATRWVFEQAGDIGIVPVFFDECRYDATSDSYVIDGGTSAAAHSISGSLARDMLMAGVSPPSWFMREEVSAVVLNRIRQGEEVFIK
jgi:pyruvate kinase